MSFSTLLTRVNTSNCGNQALSAQLRVLLERVLGTDVAVLERFPPYLSKFSVGRTTPEEMPSVFDAWADRMIDYVRAHPEPEAAVANGRAAAFSTSINIASGTHGRLLPLTRTLNTRAVAARLGLRDKLIPRRLALYEGSDWVVLNPAGEVIGKYPDLPIRLYLDAWSAKKVGARVAIVNQTIEAEDDRVTSVIRFLFPRVDAVFVRDQPSFDWLQAAGVDCANVQVVGDAAIMTDPSSFPASSSAPVAPVGAIGLAIHTQASEHQFEQWAQLARRLSELGRPIVFVSNEQATDLPFAQRLAARVPMQIQPEALDFKAYCRFLAPLAVVVGSRLHTALLATTAGVPCVPIEPRSHKVRGTLGVIGLPVATISPADTDWVDRAMAATTRTLNGEAPSRAMLQEVAAKARLQIEDAYRQVLGGRVSSSRSIEDKERA